MIGVVVPQMLISLGWGTYLFFGCFCFAASVFSFFFVPETSGKTLEEIGDLFGDSEVMAEEAIRQRILEEVWNNRTEQTV